MPSQVDSLDIVLRLACALLAGGLLGLNREVKGHPAGLRTTILVCLAAALVMVLANLLLDTRLPEGAGYSTFDVLRLPLGLLSGVGFLGAGAIIRRGDAVQGVTTAATLWFVTMVGLCLGAGLFGLGAGATALGLLVLWGLRLAERYMPRVVRSRLVLAASAASLPQDRVLERLAAEGYKLEACEASYPDPDHYRLELRLHRLQSHKAGLGPPPLFAELTAAPDVTEAEWKSAS